MAEIAEPVTQEVKTPEEQAADFKVAEKLDALSSFLGKGQVEEMKKELGAPAKEEDKKEDENKDNKDSENTGVDTEKEKADKLAAEATKAEEAKKTDKKSVFGFKKPGEKKGSDIVIENPEQILEVVKSKFGQEYKDIAELPKFFETAQGWRSKAEKADKVEKDYNQIVDFLNSAPEEIIESLKKFELGQDYTEPFAGKPRFDFNKSADKQDIKTLVNHYYPGKFTEEDLKDENPSELLQMAMDTSKDKFIAEKQAHDVKRAQVTERATSQLKAQNLSIQSSVIRLKQAFPEAEEDSIKEVQSVFEGGPNNVLSFFYNNDGTVKPEAAEMFLMAKYGKEEIERMMDISSHITETKINEDLITRGADTRKPVKTAGVIDKISEAEQEKIRELDRIAGKTKRTF